MDKQRILIADKMKIKSENHESFVILFGTQESSSLHPTKPYQHFRVHYSWIFVFGRPNRKNHQNHNFTSLIFPYFVSNQMWANRQQKKNIKALNNGETLNNTPICLLIIDHQCITDSFIYRWDLKTFDDDDNYQKITKSSQPIIMWLFAPFKTPKCVFFQAELTFSCFMI